MIANVAFLAMLTVFLFAAWLAGGLTFLAPYKGFLFRRHGEVIEVIGRGEREHYRIRWQDGHESVYFPGPDARVVSAG